MGFAYVLTASPSALERYLLVSMGVFCWWKLVFSVKKCHALKCSTLQLMKVTVIKFSVEGGVPVSEDRLYILIYRIIYRIGYISLHTENLQGKNPSYLPYCNRFRYYSSK